MSERAQAVFTFTEIGQLLGLRPEYAVDTYTIDDETRELRVLVRNDMVTSGSDHVPDGVEAPVHHRASLFTSVGRVGDVQRDYEVADRQRAELRREREDLKGRVAKLNVAAAADQETINRLRQEVDRLYREQHERREASKRLRARHADDRLGWSEQMQELQRQLEGTREALVSEELDRLRGKVDELQRTLASEHARNGELRDDRDKWKRHAAQAAVTEIMQRRLNRKIGAEKAAAAAESGERFETGEKAARVERDYGDTASPAAEVQAFIDSATAWARRWRPSKSATDRVRDDGSSILTLEVREVRALGMSVPGGFEWHAAMNHHGRVAEATSQVFETEGQAIDQLQAIVAAHVNGKLEGGDLYRWPLLSPETIDREHGDTISDGFVRKSSCEHAMYGFAQLDDGGLQCRGCGARFGS